MGETKESILELIANYEGQIAFASKMIEVFEQSIESNEKIIDMLKSKLNQGGY